MEAGLEHSHDVRASQIRDEIVHALHHSWFFDHDAITVTVEDGRVRLTGTVPSAHDRRRAAIAAWTHPGVVDVDNHIEVN
jgi:osmotically-inducible protein OsmY